MDRVKHFVAQNFKTDPEKFGYWEAFGSLLLTPFEVQQRRYAAYRKPEPIDDTAAEATTVEEPTTIDEATMAKSTSNGNTGQNEQGGVDVSFTAEEDATIKEMKHRGDSWRQIAGALQKSQTTIKKRWNEIATPEQKAAAAKNAGEKKGQQAKKPQEASKTNAPGDKDKKTSKAERGGDPGHSAPQVDRPQFINGLQPICVYPDETFSASDLVWLCNAFIDDNEERFIRLSSRFFDLTGRRIHPHTIKKKLMQSGLPP